MGVHRLTTITVGVPDVATTARFYREFGLTETAPGVFNTTDGGEQLRLVTSPSRRLVELGIGADDPDDLARIAAAVTAFGATAAATDGGATVVAVEPVTGTRVVITVADRLDAKPAAVPVSNDYGRTSRVNERADVLTRLDGVAPRKLGHVVLGSPDQDATQRFFLDALGFKVSDSIPGIAAFLRCSTDHHNLLVQAAPVTYLHHTSWQVDDVDDIGRGAKALLDADPARHVWGLGRHHIGSNFFWYLRDPAGNFAEYYADLDVIVDDEVWQPGEFLDERALYAWGPPPPPSFISPDDLTELMATT